MIAEGGGRSVAARGRVPPSVPQHPALWSLQDVHAFHVRRYAGTGLRRKVEAGGFEVVRMTSFVSLLLPMSCVGSGCATRPGADGRSDAIDAVRLPRLVNKVLEGVMAVERALIQWGVSFPAGGSFSSSPAKPSSVEAAA